MLTALGRSNQGDVLLVGLSRENLTRICDGKPVKIDLKAAQMETAEHVVIFAGETEADLERSLQEAAQDLPIHTGRKRPW